MQLIKVYHGLLKGGAADPERRYCSPLMVKDIWELGADLKGGLRYCSLGLDRALVPRASKAALRKAEESLLSFVKTPIEFGYVNIGNFESSPEEPVKVWTAVINKGSPGSPTRTNSRFASGLGLWALNYDGLGRI
ncbi:hypothetical protein Ocin01_18774 [Orchesella cincta]|uniref:Uncharacterized protein n=1 Tax=Orchesella cincta TaxID=48709 RepID=A0A1D2M4K9_ORCCI|nr:hypothetical protein Ocin01_18774 [Orchesella cincta]